MADNTQTFTTRIFLNSEEAKKRLDELQRKVEDLRKKKEEAAKAGDWPTFNSLKKQLDQTNKEIVQIQVSAQKVDRILGNLSSASIKEINQTIKAINKEMSSGSIVRGSEEWKFLNEQLVRCKQELKNIKNESKIASDSIGRENGFFKTLGNLNQIGILFNNVFGYSSGLQSILSSLRSLVGESLQLAESAEGVELAYQRLDRPDLLNGLREATHGTVTDLELMKQAVKFKDFNLPVEQLGKYLAFAQQKAKDTGESIDYLVTSIVNGLGRQSKPILDNLGISAKDIEAEVEKTGDFVKAVTNIVERNMQAMGEYAETASDRAAKASTRLQNEQAALGKQLLPMKSAASGLFTEMQLGFLSAIRFALRYREVILTVAKALAVYATAYAALYAWQQRHLAITALTAAKEATLNALRKAGIVLMGAYRVAVALLTGNVVRATVAIRAMGIAMKTNPYTALLSVVLTLGTAIYGLISAFSKGDSAVRKNSDALQQHQQQLRNIKRIEEEANRASAERVAKVNLLRKTVEDVNETYAKRKAALEELRRIVPEYHGHLSKERGLYNSNAEAIDAYIKKLQDAATAQAAMSKMTDITERIMNADLEIMRKQQELEKKRKEFVVDTSDSQQYGEYLERTRKLHESALQIGIDQLRKTKNEAQNELDDLNKYLKDRGIDPTRTSMPETREGRYNNEEDDAKAERERLKAERDRLKAAEQAAKAESDAMIAAKTHEYAVGKISYRQYIKDMESLQREGLKRRRDVYQQGSAEYEKLNREIEELDFKGTQQMNQLKLEDLQRCKLREQAIIEAQAARHEITEREKQERLRLLEETYLADKVDLYKEGSKERIDAEWELEQTEQRNKIQREQEYQETVRRLRSEYLRMGNDEQIRVAIEGLEDLHRRQLLSEEEYQRMKLAIQAQYAQNPTERRNEEFDATVNDAISVARANATGGYDKSQGMSLANNPIMGEVAQYRSVMQQLQTMREQDRISHQEYEQAKAQVTSEFLANMVSQVQTAYESVNQVMQAASSYYAAQSQYEQAVTTRKYDREIEAAGNNEKRRKKIEEQKQKELAKIKTKYNKKAMKIEIAQAFASTAMAAINSYASASKEHWLLGAVAAAMATAAGMMQIATIKKQHAAEEAGYYEGGFTGGSNWRKRAGVVHEGEFVVNHEGVANPNLLPILRAIDVAQRNNTIGRITPVDIGMGNGGTNVVTPIVNVNNDNSELDRSISSMNETISRLNDTLAKGINADVYLDGPDGLAAKQKRFEQLTK